MIDSIWTDSNWYLTDTVMQCYLYSNCSASHCAC